MRYSVLIAILACSLTGSPFLNAQPSLREKIGQMLMVTFTGDSLEKSSPSLDTLKADLAEKRIGGVIFFTWSGNLRSPDQIRHLTDQLQAISPTPLLIATDQEGGLVARLSASNGFAPTQSAQNMGTDVNTESNTRAVAGMMAGWFEQIGINMNLAPVVDVNVNPASPAIGALGRSFSSSPSIVTQHAGWFIDEFHKKRLITTLKHFPGHGSAVGDSHLGFTDVTNTWSTSELIPYQDLITSNSVDAIMTAHIFNATIDTTYPATLSTATMTDLLRTQLGFDGVVVSDAMGMNAITNTYGEAEAALLAVRAGVDILLYTRNLSEIGTSLAGDFIDVIEAGVLSGEIPAQRIDESYERIMRLKQNYLTHTPLLATSSVPDGFSVGTWPNPFNGSASIRVQLPHTGHLSVTIYDLLGRKMAQLHDGHVTDGPATFRWTPRSEPSGTYIVRAMLNGTPSAQRLVYIR